MRDKPGFAWCIAYIDSSTLGRLDRDLQKSNQYQDIEAYVPTVRVLKKQFKGKNEFEDVPLFFNYGFFKIPLNWALNMDLLLKIRDDITCISHWVKDPAKVHSGLLLSRKDIPIATVDDHQLETIRVMACEYNIFSSEDIDNLKEGDEITLKGYPFDGLNGVVTSIDKKSKKIKLDLHIDFTTREVTVSFENVFYSIYQGSHDENYNIEKTLTDYQSTKVKNLIED